jgi:hypothetical protein
VINAQYPQANVSEERRIGLNVSQTGFGLKLQLDLTIHLAVDVPQVRRELLRALIVEMMYRSDPTVAEGTVYSSPPDWLIEGVPAQQVDVTDRFTNILAVPAAVHSILPIEKFVRQKRDLLDAPSQLLYRAYSIALMELLVHTREGPKRLAQFVLHLPSASNDPMADLRFHFPGLFGSEAETEKTWKTQIARFSSPQSFQLLSSGETEQILEKTLHLNISGAGSEKTCGLATFATFIKNPAAHRLLAALAHNLNVLAVRAHPVYRPIILDYGKITALLLRGKTKGVAGRLETLTALRRSMADRTRRIDDYMNWFEATKLLRPSGEFADYMKAVEASTHPSASKRDPISVYLDALEVQFED